MEIKAESFKYHALDIGPDRYKNITVTGNCHKLSPMWGHIGGKHTALNPIID